MPRNGQKMSSPIETMYMAHSTANMNKSRIEHEMTMWNDLEQHCSLAGIMIETKHANEKSSWADLKDDGKDLETQQPHQIASQLTVQVVASPCVPFEVHSGLHCFKSPDLHMDTNVPGTQYSLLSNVITHVTHTILHGDRRADAMDPTLHSFNSLLALQYKEESQLGRVKLCMLWFEGQGRL